MEMMASRSNGTAATGELSRWIAVLVCFLAISAGAATFSTSLSRDTVVLGETVTLALKLEGGQFPGNPGLPAIPGVQVGHNVSQNLDSRQGPDGKMTSAHTFSYTLVPQRAGEIIIPGLNLEINGQQFASAPLKLQVLRADPHAPPAELANELAFLWLALPKTEFYVGEAFVAELRLYVRQGVQNISDFNLPAVATDGFTASRLQPGQQFERRVGNAQFTVVPQYVALTPVKSGPLKLGGVNGSLVVHLPLENRRQRDIFSLFGPQSEPRQVALQLPELPIRVLKLPAENVPDGFSGAIGTFTVQFTAGPTNVATGDPVTVRIQITGTGALDSIGLPPQPAWNAFKTYPPTVETRPTDQFGLRGTKTFEQVISPETVEIKELPAFTFSYFDPEVKAYRTLSQPPIPLVVRPGGVASAPSIAAPTATSAQSPPAPQDIVPIKQRLGRLAPDRPPLHSQSWFVASQSVPVLVFAAALLWRRRTETLANNPRLRRQKQVARIISEGLGRLPQLAAGKQSDEFFALVFRLLQEQLGERLDLPASAITEAVVDERLKPGTLSDAIRATLHELFQTCNAARYAPAQSSQELAGLIPKLETVLRALQEVRP
jgi:hypothetical protein